MLPKKGLDSFNINKCKKLDNMNKKEYNSKITNKELKMDFEKFAKIVKENFDEMSKSSLYRSGCTLDLRDEYIKAFPEGSNKMYITNTTHTCNCCFDFIKNIGKIVSLENGVIHTIWDIDESVDLGFYRPVTDLLSKLVIEGGIISVFYAGEKRYGDYKTTQLLDNEKQTLLGLSKNTIDWNHFYCTIPNNVYKGADTNKIIGSTNTSASVLRSTMGIGVDKLVCASKEILSLIESDNLYRGDEHKNSLVGFVNLLSKFYTYPSTIHNFSFENSNSAYCKFKNTVVGELVLNVIEDGLEVAVLKYEQMVAPINYKRPKALISQGMIDSALLKINELGLESALHRRLANIHDISVNNVLWADGQSMPLMKDSLQALIKPTKQIEVDTDKATDVDIKDFLQKILPKTKSLSMYSQKHLLPNMVTLIAPIEDTEKRLFMWDNNYSWSYQGGVADSDIKACVREVGGDVEGLFRCSLMWNEKGLENECDLDLSCITSLGTVYYGLRRIGDVELDIDIIKPLGEVAVENITYNTKGDSVKDGVYVFKVINFTLRTPNKYGFKAEFEMGKDLFLFEYPRPLGQKEEVEILRVTITNGKPQYKFSIEPTKINKGEFVKVNSVMLSPNFWNNQQVGNKHYIFTTDSVKANVATTRGFYNEFLHYDLVEHRKVFEVLGGKIHIENTEQQLTGFGFSSTQRNSALVKADGRLYNILF